VRAADTGRVRAVLVRPGQAVRAGQPIVLIDAASALAALESARAGEQAARSEAARAGAMFDGATSRAAAADAAASRQERLWEAALTSEADVAAARHDAHVARLASVLDRQRVTAAAAHVRAEHSRVLDAVRALDRTVERSPADGIVRDVMIRAGEWVHAGGPNVPPTVLLTIGAESLGVEATIAQHDALQLPVGWPATVSIHAQPLREWPARVAGLRDTPQGAVTVRLELQSQPSDIRDGMSCTVRFTAASRARSIVVPNHALVTVPGGKGVWTISRGVIVPLGVRLGLRGDSYSEVLDGLSPGQLVVTGPHAVLRAVRAGDAVAIASSSFVRSLRRGRDEGSD
jgi:HlyD family secretion protein